MQLISLFSGEGGFELAATWAGWDVVSTCEINPFCQHVLRYYWPDAYHHDNVKTLTSEIIKEKSRWDSGAATCLVGGFPCQPFSVAGQRKGTEDERHLWPEMFRIIQECKPKWIVGENVRGFVNWNGGMVFEQVCAELESEGYEVLPFILPAAGVGAPHRRDRVWIVAYASGAGTGNQSGKADNQGRNTSGNRAKSLRQAYGEISASGAGSASADGPTPHSRLFGPSERQEYAMGAEQSGQESFVADTKGKGLQRRARFQNENARRLALCGQNNGTESNKFNREHFGASWWRNFPTQPPLRGRDDGFPDGLAGLAISEAKWRNESIHAHGNAVVPQIPYLLFQVINQLESSGNS